MGSPQGIDGHGVLLPGVYPTRADAREAAARWLTSRGMDAWDVESHTAGQVDRAWWGGDDVGFVDQQHASAVPVTVVHPA